MAAWAACFQGINLNTGCAIMRWKDDVKSTKTKVWCLNCASSPYNQCSLRTMARQKHLWNTCCLLRALTWLCVWPHDWEYIYICTFSVSYGPSWTSLSLVFRLMYLCLVAASALCNNELYWNTAYKSWKEDSRRSALPNSRDVFKSLHSC